MLQPPEKVAAQMRGKGVKGDYVFFFAYAQPTSPERGTVWSGAEELVKVNSKCIRLVHRLFLIGLQQYSQAIIQFPSRAGTKWNYSQACSSPARREVLRGALGSVGHSSGGDRRESPYRAQLLLHSGRLYERICQET